MDGHKTSGLMFSYFPKSNYHDSCIPAERKAIVEQQSSGKQYRDAEYTNCDQVSQDTIWKQAVGTERRCLKNWETSWGFLTEFDAQGNEKEKEQLPEKSSVFSDNIPNTNSGNYGNRVTTDIGQSMAQMEYQFYSGGRRKKLGKDMICY